MLSAKMEAILSKGGDELSSHHDISYVLHKTNKSSILVKQPSPVFSQKYVSFGIQSSKILQHNINHVLHKQNNICSLTSQ